MMPASIISELSKITDALLEVQHDYKELHALATRLVHGWNTQPNPKVATWTPAFAELDQFLEEHRP